MIAKFHWLHAGFLPEKVCVVEVRLGGFEAILGNASCRFPFGLDVNLFFNLVGLFEVVFLGVVVVTIRFLCLLILFFLLKFLMQPFVFKKGRRAALEFCLNQLFLFLIIIL